MAFASSERFMHHLRIHPHFGSFEYMSCACAFRTEGALDDHLASEGHALVEQAAARAEQEKEAATNARAAREEAALRCETCPQSFKTLNGFRQHKASVKHKPLSEMKCPLSDKCVRVFTSPSALLFHLESGGCKSGMRREQLHAIVHQHVNSHHITSATGALRAGESRASIPGSRATIHDIDDDLTDSGGAILTPDDSDVRSMTSNLSGVLLTPEDSDIADISVDGSVVLLTPSISQTSQNTREWDALTPNTFIPSSNSVAGSASAGDGVRYNPINKTWSCNLCNRRFHSHKAVMQHLNSVVHAPQIFHCPVDLAGMLGSNKPMISFKTLIGLAQHIETGAYKGGMETLKMVVRIFEKEIQMRLGEDGEAAQVGVVASGRFGT